MSRPYCAGYESSRRGLVPRLLAEQHGDVFWMRVEVPRQSGKEEQQLPGTLFGEAFHQYHLAEYQRWGAILPKLGLKVGS